MASDEVSSRHQAGIVLDPSLYATVTLSQQDTYGDGWTGNYISIYEEDGQTLVHTITGPSSSDGTSIINEDLNLPNDANYVWTATSDEYPTDVRLWIYNSEGTDLLAGALSSGISSTTTGTFAVGTPPQDPAVSSSVNSYTENTIVIDVTFNQEALTASSGWSYRTDADFSIGQPHGGTFVSISSSEASISVTPGQNSVYIAAVDSSGLVIAKAPALSVNTVAVNVALDIYKTDSYGDGWNGGTLVITDSNNTVVLSTTLTDGGKDSPIIEQVQLMTGSYNYTFTADDFPTEIAFSILVNQTNEQIAQVSQGTLTSSGDVATAVSYTHLRAHET